MHSIRTKITALTLAAILMSVLAIGGIGIAFIKLQGDQSAENEMRLLCENRVMTLDRYLLSIEQSVDMVVNYITETLEGVDLTGMGVAGATGYGDSLAGVTRTDAQRRALDEMLANHIGHIEAVFRSVAKHTNGVISYYYRINPELSDTQKGFIYNGIDRARFHRAGMVDIFDYERDDTSHVGWYYTALDRKAATWIDPYFNATLGIDMISYVSPIYRGDTLVGVIGMDISCSKLVSKIENIRVYDTGYACLTDSMDRLVYHPKLTAGIDIDEMIPEVTSAEGRLDGTMDDIMLVQFVFEGVPKMAAIQALDSGLRLIIVAPMREINADMVKLMRTVLAAALALMLAFALVTFTAMKRVTDPLRRLVEASEKLADGDYEVKLDYLRDDEVGTLTRSFQHLVAHLRTYITDLNRKAYRDAMTGVKNKTAFDSYAQELDQAIRDGKKPEFALVMMDCNELKEINDAYGHDKGDAYLQTTCRMICATFVHSPVFRIGGDEFVALLQDTDFQNRKALLSTFDAHYKEFNARAENPWSQVSLALGMAVYDPMVDADVESVLRRADERMYLEKKRGKQKA